MPLHVLLLDEGFMSGAFTAVGLRGAGCRVTIVAAVGGHGQYDARGITWSLGPTPNDPRYLTHVDTLVRQGAFDRIVPLTEPIQTLLWSSEITWLDRVIPRPAPWQQALLADKQCMAAFIAGHGVAVPRELHLTESSESLGTPFVLKGVRGRGGAATHIVRSRGDAERAAARLRDRGIACFAQEYVAGSTFLVGGLFRKGEPVRLYAGEKLVQYPSRTGPAAVIRSIDSEQLVMNALTVMKALAWTGLASVDFVRDATGRFLFLEVNPRPWGSIVAAADAGVELWAPLATLMEGGAPAQSLAYRAGVTSVILPLALLSGASWRSWSALSGMVRAAAGPQRAIWWPPRRGAHVARRLLLMSRRWTDGP